MQLRQTLGADVTGGEGVLDPAVIGEISSEVWPEARDADELHDAMLTLVRMPAVAEWQAFYEELLAARRASIITRGEKTFWIATERLSVADDANAVIAGWMESLGQ